MGTVGVINVKRRFGFGGNGMHRAFSLHQKFQTFGKTKEMPEILMQHQAGIHSSTLTDPSFRRNPALEKRNNLRNKNRKPEIINFCHIM